MCDWILKLLLNYHTREDLRDVSLALRAISGAYSAIAHLMPSMGPIVSVITL